MPETTKLTHADMYYSLAISPKKKRAIWWRNKCRSLCWRIVRVVYRLAYGKPFYTHVNDIRRDSFNRGYLEAGGHMRTISYMKQHPEKYPNA